MSFTTEQPSQLTVTVHGKDDKTTFTHTYDAYETKHSIPVYALYGGEENHVTLQAVTTSGESITTGLTIVTDPVPASISPMDVSVPAAGVVAEGLTFTSGFELVGYDLNGDVRWYSTLGGRLNFLGPVRLLQNGHLASFGGDTLGTYYKSHLYEFTLLGRIVAGYPIPGNTAHHGLFELPDGNFLTVINDYRNGTVEDAVLVIERGTGTILDTLNMKDILPLSDYLCDAVFRHESKAEATAVTQLAAAGVDSPTEAQLNEAAHNIARHDWMHINAVAYDPSDKCIVLSGRNLSALIKVDYRTHELKWILTNPESAWVKENPQIQPNLLTPTTGDFAYQYAQHAPAYLPDGTLMFFDNHAYGNVYENGDEQDNLQNYSRMVILDIDDEKRTVSVATNGDGNRAIQCIPPSSATSPNWKITISF